MPPEVLNDNAETADAGSMLPAAASVDPDVMIESDEDAAATEDSVDARSDQGADDAGGRRPPQASVDPDVVTGSDEDAAATEDGADAGSDQGAADAGAAVPGAGDTDTACVVMEDSDEAWRGADCEHFELVVDELELVDARDGIAPGQSAELRARLSDVSGLGYYRYPGLEFSADDPRVSFGPYGNASWLYAVLACQQMPVSITATFGDTIPPGTTVVLSARPAALNQTCKSASTARLRIVVD